MLTLSPPPTRLLTQVTRHIERTIGHSPMVFHEMLSHDWHVNLHVVPPQPHAFSPRHPCGGDFFTIVTSGMSSRGGGSRRVELMMALPATWPGLRPDGTFRPGLMCDDAFRWPIRLLKAIAHAPCDEAFRLEAGSLFANGEPARPYARNTPFAGMILLPTALHPRARELVAHDDLSISFLSLWPLLPEELAFAQARGNDALVQSIRRAGLTELFHMNRRSAVA